MTHSITAFDRKYLAPKKREQPQSNGYADALFFIKVAALVFVALLVLDAVALLMWAFSGQFPADGFYAGALTAKWIALF